MNEYFNAIIAHIRSCQFQVISILWIFGTPGMNTMNAEKRSIKTGSVATVATISMVVIPISFTDLSIFMKNVVKSKILHWE